uniref:Gag-like protein n=1 Tax=Anopheles gambiae TaxID=7165 RepID=Q868S7_ANOGA|nr:gag-like protein [Anopheles gambiae]
MRIHVPCAVSVLGCAYTQRTKCAACLDSPDGMNGNESLHPRPLGSALKDIGAFFGRSSKTPRSPPNDNVQGSVSPAVDVVEVMPEEQTSASMECQETSHPIKEQGFEVSASKLQEALMVARELHTYTKDRNNVHAPIKKMSVSILSALSCIERELLTMKLRAERAEKALREVQSEPPETPMTGKRSRKARTPEEAEDAKRAKNDAPSCNRPDAEYSEGVKNSENGELWSTVVSKKAQRKKKMGTMAEGKQTRAGEHNGPVKPVPRRPKTEAILVETTEVSTHKDILRKLKADPELQSFGKQVVRIRSTKNGGLLFELKKSDQTECESFSGKIQQAIGEAGNVKSLGQMETVEIRFIDEETEAADVERDLRNQITGLEGYKVEVTMKTSFSGMQTALVKLPVKLVSVVTGAGKVQIGWSVCPVRINIPSRRCYRCWQTDHISQDCCGPDRRDCCLRGGEKGHFAATCRLPPRCVLCPDGSNAHHSSGAFCPAAKKTAPWK